ncbi:hypothetical protein [Roseicella frigidaeris]|uniref:hypothetical protein n=1 Tax=Roseicella frigidaeris TaxID=2230885 RepID=UPI001401DD94|nr:hypothetical protein [Roseicella frigidaeris]
MAEQQSYDFSAVEARDILADRQRGWVGFTKFLTWAIALTVLVLLGLFLFVA